jgi:glycosyltransferase involved in cell wall biosynthesis
VSAERPLVSVIVAAFNAEATIAETLRSALAQTWREIEILVVDDGSTDRTADIVAGFARADGRVLLERMSRRGACAARNRAVAASRGEYLAPLDADDLWHPAKLERQMSAMRAAPRRPGFVYAYSRLIDGEGNVVGAGTQCPCRGDVLNRLAYKFFVGNGSTALCDRAALIEAGGYEETLRDSDDYLLLLRIARRHPVELVPLYLVGYRRRCGSLSADADKVFEGWSKASAMFRRECGDVPVRIWAWALAKRRFELGMARLRQRRWRSGAASLASALWLDPERTLRLSGWMLMRRVRGWLRPVPKPGLAPIPFGAICEGEAPPRPAWPDRFEHTRLQRLARLDERRRGTAEG